MAEKPCDGETEFTATASETNVSTDPEAVARLIPEFQHASLVEAVQKAMASLNSTLITWRIAEVKGSLGGFTQVVEVKTTIYAKPG